MRATDLRSTLFAALASVLCGACGGGASEPPRPDVVLVVVDTLRADHLPIHGYPRDTAPFLSELAERGVVFERAWSASSWTAPATASIFSGVYPLQHGVVSGLYHHKRREQASHDSLSLNRIPDEIETIPELMRDLGYETFGVADNPNLCEEMGFASGFDRFEGSSYKGAEHVNAKLATLGASLTDSDAPRFVYLHYMDPHKPYHDREASGEVVPPSAAPDAGAPEAGVGTRTYDSEIVYWDELLRAAFEQLGVTDDTVVIVTADHGEEFGDHGGDGHRYQVFRELLHVPLVIVAPGVERGSPRVAADVSTIDLLPTLRELLGTRASAQDAGASLMPLYRGGGADPDRAVLAMRTDVGVDASRELRSVIRNGEHWIQSLPDGSEMLFDLLADPTEQRNLAIARADRAAELRARFEDFAERAPRWNAGTTTIELDDAARSELGRLGYAGDADGE